MQNLIAVFKPANPDAKIYADQAQINANPASLIPWRDRDTFLRNRKKPAPAKPTAAPAGAEPTAPPAPDTPPEGEPEAGRKTKAELLAEAEKLGLAVHPRATVAQIEKMIAEKS